MGPPQARGPVHVGFRRVLAWYGWGWQPRQHVRCHRKPRRQDVKPGAGWQSRRNSHNPAVTRCLIRQGLAKHRCIIGRGIRFRFCLGAGRHIQPGNTVILVGRAFGRGTAFALDCHRMDQHRPSRSRLGGAQGRHLCHVMTAHRANGAEPQGDSDRLVIPDKPPALLQTSHLRPPLCQDHEGGVALRADIADQLVYRGVEHRMDRHSQFHHTQR